MIFCIDSQGPSSFTNLRNTTSILLINHSYKPQKPFLFEPLMVQKMFVKPDSLWYTIDISMAIFKFANC